MMIKSEDLKEQIQKAHEKQTLINSSFIASYRSTHQAETSTNTAVVRHPVAGF
ncbi:MAG: hypothetical protein Q4G70_02675 [Pseudomonadota bacterium]|nr:hypothetical protein [Pseudomonadota bacterium]